jgi:hypothetical protein
MKHQFRSMKDQFNGMTEKRCPPPHLIGHEFYEMVKVVHVVLGKWKRTSKFTETSEYLKQLGCGPIFTDVTYQGYDINGYTLYTEQWCTC